jgi:hypothetical protein
MRNATGTPLSANPLSPADGALAKAKAAPRPPVAFAALAAALILALSFPLAPQALADDQDGGARLGSGRGRDDRGRDDRGRGDRGRGDRGRDDRGRDDRGRDGRGSDDGSARLGPGRRSYLGPDGHPREMPWIPPGSAFYERNLREQERERRRGGRRHFGPGQGGARYYSRHDNGTWPQATVNLSWGLYGEYSRWRDDPYRGFADPRFGAMFSYVDRNVALRLAAIPDPTPRQVEYETLVEINAYLNDHLETIAVGSDGSYFVMFRSNQGGEGEWVETEVTSDGVERAARSSNQLGGR